MNAPDRYRAWVDANQRLLVAEIARLKRRLGVEADAEPLDAALVAARAAMPEPAAIDHLAGCCGLSAFERDVALLCAGVEMDAQLAAQCALATGESRRPGATFGLALASLEAPHWSALTPAGPLRRWRLIDVDDSAGLARGLLRIDERILHYLAGANYLDVRLSSLLRPALPPTTMAETQRAVADDARSIVETAAAGESPLLWLTGDDAFGQADVAAGVAAALGLGLYVLQARDVPAGNAEIEALATLWQREAMLLGSALLVSGGTQPLPAAAVRFVEQLRGLVFISASQPQALERPARYLRVDKPGPVEQKHLWQQALGDGALRLNGALDGIASQFKLSARTIQIEGARLAPTLAASERPDSIVWSACRTIGSSRLDELAQRIESVAGWGDLVLPEAQKAVLQQIGSHVRNRLKVHVEWGFSEKGPRGFGISALFAGESGTGKTMAAEVLARELQIDLYRIDLSALVSKYIGETEKNLRRVFDAAEDSGAILLFDEADALFGKRSDVKDSHDRYANIEVSYLLQRMESYRGLAILTTNLKAALDTAFQRRLRFVVHFPFPDQALRKAIWQSAFPARTPRGHVDCEKLARLSVTGGSIRNIAINAAFRAAELNEPVSMAHLLHATRNEASKRDRPLSDAEIRGWE
jgi:ATPase family associated with various cellular activities (AAA)